MLVGRCGLTAEQAGWTSWDEFQMRRDGKVQEERAEWERLRWAKFIDLQMNPHIKKQHKPRTPKEWIRFEWEKEDKKKQPMKDWKMTEREKERMQEIFNRKRR